VRGEGPEPDRVVPANISWKKAVFPDAFVVIQQVNSNMDWEDTDLYVCV
jgi:hypothetical protein